MEILNIEVSKQTKFISADSNLEEEVSTVFQEIPKLLKKQIVELARVGKEIEKIYKNVPVDIEWACIITTSIYFKLDRSLFEKSIKSFNTQKQNSIFDLTAKV